MIYESQKTAVDNELAAVTIEQLNQWKAEHKAVHIITVTNNENKKVTGYFKKADIKTINTYIDIDAQLKTDEARQFLLTSTFLGRDKEILEDVDFSLVAGLRLWSLIFPLPAQATNINF